MAEAPYHERIEDPLLRQAVDLLDAGDASTLRTLLQQYPDLVHRTVTFEPGYFHTPTLLAFCAENPTRRNTLPPTIVEATRVILDAGPDLEQIHYTLALVSSGRIAREGNVQVPLIDLLCDYGAIPDRAIEAAVAHGEFAAVDGLLRRGAALDLPTAAALGRVADSRFLLASATSDERHKALAFAAQHGRLEVVRLLLKTGEDPNRYNPPNCHAHSTPLHQAVLAGHFEVVRFLVEGGARFDIKDKVFESDALGWAEYCGQPEIAAYLRAER
jgi:peptide-methionine (S)-S-oxide reductase